MVTMSISDDDLRMIKEDVVDSIEFDAFQNYVRPSGHRSLTDQEYPFDMSTRDFL